MGDWERVRMFNNLQFPSVFQFQLLTRHCLVQYRKVADNIAVPITKLQKRRQQPCQNRLKFHAKCNRVQSTIQSGRARTAWGRSSRERSVGKFECANKSKNFSGEMSAIGVSHKFYARTIVAPCISERRSVGVWNDLILRSVEHVDRCGGSLVCISTHDTLFKDRYEGGIVD